MAYLLDVDAAPFQPDGDLVHEDKLAAPVVLDPVLLDGLWLECGARGWGLERGDFDRIILLIAMRPNFGLAPGAIAGKSEQTVFFRNLKLEDLVLALACAMGHERAWGHFMAIYGQPLTRAAIAISGNDTVGRDLADTFYAELYGLSTKDGTRKCPLESYRGRGSLMGWLRASLAQRFIDHYRRAHREEPLDERTHDAAASDQDRGPQADAVSTLREAIQSALSSQPAEVRFVLASYYADGRTLAEIGQLLRVHEATVSRRLKRATDQVRKKLLKNLEQCGMSRRAAEEALGTDPRDVDLKMDLKKLLQSSGPAAFSEEVRLDSIAQEVMASESLGNPKLPDRAKAEG